MNDVIFPVMVAAILVIGAILGQTLGTLGDISRTLKRIADLLQQKETK